MMKQEEKNLLIEDLCSRLPYGVIVCVEHDWFEDEVPPYDCELNVKNHTILNNFFENPLSCDLTIKPYLRPMPEMTEEEHSELSKMMNDDSLFTGDAVKTVCLHCGVVIDFHNKKHMDWRGLIEKGLALPAPKDMYKDE